MLLEKFNLEELSQARRKALSESIRSVEIEELRKIGNEIFRFADDPWRDAFFRFIDENKGATFHHAVTSDGVNIIYCAEKKKGMWFLPGSGMGPLRERGQKVMTEIIQAKR